MTWMIERALEKYLVQRVESARGLALKWASPGQRGVPDRLVLFAGRAPVAVEVKSPGAKPSAMQARTHQQLTTHGLPVYVLDSEQTVDDFIRQCGGAR